MSIASGVSFRKYILLYIYLLIIISVGIVYFDTLKDLFNKWIEFDTSLGHGLLVVVTVLYLLIKHISSSKEPVNPFLYALLPLVILSLVWALAYSVGVEIVEQLVIPILIFFSVLLLAGGKQASKVLVPIMLLYFAIPIWDYLNSTLLFLTSATVQWLIRLSDITAYIEGNSIFLPFGEILIAEGCSGLRYFIIGLFIAVLSSHLYFKSPYFKVILVLMGVVLSLLANWVRVYIIIIVAYVSNMKSNLVENHELLGWFIFVGFMSPIFYLNYRYQYINTELYRVDEKNNQHVSGLKLFIAIVMFLTAIIVGPILLQALNYLPAGQAEAEISVPVENNIWKLKNSEPDRSWMASGLEDYKAVDKTYERNDLRINYVIYVFRKKDEYGEILPYIPSIFNNDRWSQLSHTRLEIMIGDEVVPFSSIVIIDKFSREKIVILYKYNVAGYDTANYGYAKIYQIAANLLRHDRAFLTILSLSCKEDCNNESGILREFSEEYLSQKNS